MRTGARALRRNRRLAGIVLTQTVETRFFGVFEIQQRKGFKAIFLLSFR